MIRRTNGIDRLGFARGLAENEPGARPQPRRAEPWVSAFVSHPLVGLLGSAAAVVAMAVLAKRVFPLPQIAAKMRRGVLESNTRCGPFRGVTDIGLEPGHANEDAIAAVLSPGTWTRHETLNLIVADGVGSYTGSEEASSAATHALVTALGNDASLKKACAAARRDWKRLAKDWGTQHPAVPRDECPDTVLLLAQLDPVRATARFAHLGDARAVVFRSKDAGLREVYRTRDHSYVETRVRPRVKSTQRREFTDAEARAHPMNHVITRSLGDPHPSGSRPEISPQVRLQDGDWIVLGSDGLWDNLNVAEVGALVGRSETTARALEALEETIRTRMASRAVGTKPDNYSVILHHFHKLRD